MGAVESEKNDKRNKPEDYSATNLGLLKVLQKRIVSISIKLLMLLSIVGVFYTIKSEGKFTLSTISALLFNVYNVKMFVRKDVNQVEGYKSGEK